MLLKQETYKQQSLLTQYCQTGLSSEQMKLRYERLPNYRRLVFNVVKDALETTYPIAYKYLDREIWDTLVYNFFATHKCQHPQVWRMPKEFFEFCKTENYSTKYNIPYLNDLLYFEWLETEMYVMEDFVYPEYKKSTHWLKEKIAVNPEHKIIKLEYPVHLEKPENTTDKKGSYFLLLFREKESGRIQFVNLSVLFTFLLENIVLQQKTLEEIINDILLIFGINDLGMLQKEADKFLKDLLHRGFVLGVAN